MGDIRVGISGWSYPRWRGDFYPKGLVQRRELEYAAERMSSIEINGSFYSLQRPSSYAAWRDAVPDDFLFAVKGGRFISHMKRLRGVETALANFFASGVLALGRKLGPLLWQLPASLRYDAELLGAFYDQLPRSTAAAAELAARHDDKLRGDRLHLEVEEDLPLRHALEFRHRSFCSDEAFDQMRSHGIGCVISDSPGRWPEADVVTSDLVYIRLHGHTELYASGYSAQSLRRWADRCREWAAEADVFVYFDNDARGRAPHDAVALIEQLRPG